MQKVIFNFKIYLGVELSLLVLSIVVLLLSSPGTIIRGAAMGLAIQAVFTAVLDLAATRRGDAYLAWLLSQPGWDDFNECSIRRAVASERLNWRFISRCDDAIGSGSTCEHL